MNNLLVFFVFILSLNCFSAEKFYYTESGWFGPWPENQAKINGEFTNTPNGMPICEVTLFDNDGLPIKNKFLKRKDGKIECPVVLDDSLVQSEIAEKEAKLAEREARKAEIAEIKGMISDINNSDLAPWLKKLLRALVRDMKE